MSKAFFRFFTFPPSTIGAAKDRLNAFYDAISRSSLRKEKSRDKDKKIHSICPKIMKLGQNSYPMGR